MLLYDLSITTVERRHWKLRHTTIVFTNPLFISLSSLMSRSKCPVGVALLPLSLRGGPVFVLSDKCNFSPKIFELSHAAWALFYVLVVTKFHEMTKTDNVGPSRCTFWLPYPHCATQPVCTEHVNIQHGSLSNSWTLFERHQTGGNGAFDGLFVALD